MAAHVGPPAAESAAVLAQLGHRLDGAMAQFPHGTFVRLSTRSPKDAALSAASFQSEARRELALLVQEEAAAAEGSNESVADTNRKLLALYR